MVNYVTKNKTEFAEYLSHRTKGKADEEKLRDSDEAKKNQKRIDELEIIIKKIYEDNLVGKLALERFNRLFADYEAEQDALNARVEELAPLTRNAPRSSRTRMNS
ncbi:hypothetical protein FACS189490_12910 [Clostridia bacterium]|nr:hypothetical protein FACS189490_12910 [Clostridia bacterium]